MMGTRSRTGNRLVRAISGQQLGRGRLGQPAQEAAQRVDDGVKGFVRESFAWITTTGQYDRVPVLPDAAKEVGDQRRFSKPARSFQEDDLGQASAGERERML